MGAFEATIGLEVHAQLETRTKLFCPCEVAFGGQPNSRVCPVCLGLPGALPVPNRAAVMLALRLAGALGATVHPVSVWARKHYFYPDLPKGYQITQYDRPLATGGRVRIDPEGVAPRWIEVARVHLEEDAGKSVHGGWGEHLSGIDLNRAGTPLAEIVSAPALTSPEQAYLYLERLKSLLQTTGVCRAEMEKGSLRCDANISLHRPGDAPGVRTEIKNLNSFRHVRRALAYEIERQREMLDRGGEVDRETRAWDERAGMTRPLRGKEEVEDYRYFPEPDLPPLSVDAAMREEAIRDLPELPHRRKDRLVRQYRLSVRDAHRLSLEPGLADYFEAAAAVSGFPGETVNWLLTELMGWLAERDGRLSEGVIPPAGLGELVALVGSGRISGKAAKHVLSRMGLTGRPPGEIVEEEGLEQVRDRQRIEEICRQTLEQCGELVAEYRRGKKAVVEALIGKALESSGGRADPRLTAETMRRLLSSL